MKLARLALVIVPALLISACATSGGGTMNAIGFPEARPVQTTARMDLLVDTEADGLLWSQMGAFQAFVDHYKSNGHGPIILSWPDGSAEDQAAQGALSELRAYLDSQGVGARFTEEGPYDARGMGNAPVIVSYMHYESVMPAECDNRRWDDLGTERMNDGYDGFGCFMAQNRAAMIGDPYHLTGPTDHDAPDEFVDDEFAPGDFGAARPFGSGASASDPVSAREPEPQAVADDFSDIELESYPVELADPMAGEIDDDIPDQPIPRITIHAFCERPESGALIHNAANDRRLAKAHVDVELGGLPAAVERFITQSTPDLLIIETGMRGQGLFDQLEELASVCDPDTKVIIIGAANDISLYRELMKRGVSEYLVPPMSPLHLIRTISGLYLDPEAPFAGKTIAFIGAKGGVGASTVAHNTAWCISENAQTDCVLVDMDLSFGTAGLDFNQDPAQTLGDALSDPDRLDEALLDRLLVRCTERLSLFSAPATLDKDWDFGSEAYETVLDLVKRQAPFITLDLPHTWSPWVRSTILGADQVVVTVTPELASLRNAKNLFDLVHASRPNDEPPKVVVNMAGVAKRPEIPVKDFADALGVQPALVLPFEPQLFGKAANDGQMIAEVDPKSKAAEGFAHLASMISGRTSVVRKKGLFGGLFGK